MEKNEEKYWEQFPLYMGYKEIMKLGFPKARIYQMFNSEDFPPMIRQKGYRVNKFKLKEWLKGYEIKDIKEDE